MAPQRREVPMPLRDWLFGVSTGFNALTPMSHLLLLLLRGLFGALAIGIGTGLLYFFDSRGQISVGLTFFFAVLLIVVLVVIFDLLARRKQITTISAIYFGLLL